MPGMTPLGYPYAQPDDALVQWPATSKALADKLDAARPVLTFNPPSTQIALQWEGTMIYPVANMYVDGTHAARLVTSDNTGKPLTLKWNATRGKLELWIDAARVGDLVVQP